MDKLKLQLAPVAKHWFWIATGLVLLSSLGVWWMASGDLINQFQANKSKIEADANSISTVSSKLDEHPNPKTHAEMEKLISASEQAVLDAWTTVYESQQDILVWPVEELTEDFVKEFRDLTPIELKVPFPTPEAEEKETSLLNQYRYYIGNVLPGIAEVARSKWTASFDKSSGGMGAMGGTGSMGSGSENYGGFGSGQPGVTAIDEGPLVRWDTASQENLLNDLFPWRSSGAPPKTLNVLYSQENLWILRQLMQIIADVNGDVAQRFQAKIHNINRIAIGSSVSTTAGMIARPALGAMGGMGDGSMMTSGGYEDMSGSMSSSGMDGMGAGAEVDPGDNRYVDVAGKPLLASQLRSALSSNSPDDAKIAVAKRIPIMMSLKMDQRAVPDLIAKCGSAQLMVEVRQVRILPTGGSNTMMSGGGGGSGGGGYGGTGMADSSGMGMGGGGTPGNEQFPLDLDVEIYGIIYIYNPPLAEKLGVEQVTEDTVIDGTAMRDGSKIESAAATSVEALPAPSDAVPADGAPANDDAVPAVPPAQPVDPAAQPVDPAAPPVDPAAPAEAPALPSVDPAAQNVPAPQPAGVQPGGAATSSGVVPPALAPVAPINAGAFWHQPGFAPHHRSLRAV
jgi:hypothetical protein